MDKEVEPVVEFDVMARAYPVKPENPPFIRRFYYVDRPGKLGVILPVDQLPSRVPVVSTYAPGNILANRPVAFPSKSRRGLFYLQTTDKAVNLAQEKDLPSRTIIIVREEGPEQASG